MKNRQMLLILLFVTAVVHPHPAASQNHIDKMKIQKINELKLRIENNLTKFEKTIFQSDSTGYIHIYKRANQMRYLAEYSKGRVLNVYYLKKYYFNKGKLILIEQNVIETRAEWLMDIELFYLVDEKLLCWIQSGVVMSRSTDLYVQTKEKLPSYIAQIKLKYLK